ncbi:cyclic pyranopterin monophosphate synthase MoaC [Algiphilus sp.]|uniref:cyclic pyranopterin monophosphate synthase MoaC n=1 Tax=Algiphilus sp. TaxID=1872431 RepID=UPI0032EE93D5
METAGQMDAAYRMVDVGGKEVTQRRAIAMGRIRLGPIAFPRVRDGTLPKGDPLRLAEVAGIMAAKRTADLIPLCHPLGLDHVSVSIALDADEQSVTVYCCASTSARTGVEMEALVGVQTALLTVWDLAKQVDSALAIDEVRLLLKEGGRSGRWEHPDGVPALPDDLLTMEGQQ